MEEKELGKKDCSSDLNGTEWKGCTCEDHDCDDYTCHGMHDRGNGSMQNYYYCGRCGYIIQIG
jgi:hypothetical protein